MWLTASSMRSTSVLLLNQMFVAQIGVKRGFQSLELAVPIEQTPTHVPFVKQWQIVEQ
jgi:hypothetical protein